jgi:hypothetical protein
MPPPDLVFYHWSPTARRNGILRRGLDVGSMSLTRDWHPPYICFSDEPLLAWTLSGRMYPDIPSWDLWMVFAEQTQGYEAILELYNDGSGRHYVKEYRVYERVFKKNVHYLATRANNGH